MSFGIIRELPNLGSTNDGAYVQRYFLRRAVATLFECGHCMVSLNMLPEFRALKQAHFNIEATKIWDDAVKLLSGKKAKWIIESIRHDVGGHFGLEPAKRAVSSLNPKDNQQD